MFEIIKVSKHTVKFKFNGNLGVIGKYGVGTYEQEDFVLPGFKTLEFLTNDEKDSLLKLLNYTLSYQNNGKHIYTFKH